jgi:hypothetical protein
VEFDLIYHRDDLGHVSISPKTISHTFGIWEDEVIYLARRIVEKSLQMRNTEVRDANVPHLASSRQFLHLRPRLHIVPIRIMLPRVIWIRRRGPVH